MNFEHTKFLQGEYGFMQLESINERTPERCEDFPLKIKIPATVSQYPEYKRFTSFAYCIPFQVKLTENVDWGIFLGFIDNKHRIFLNGTLISSTELKEKRNYSLFYESPILLPIYEHGLKEDNVLIVKASKFNPYAEDGGGIYAGILKLDDFERILTQNQISKAYGLSKNVLFLSTSLLFFILFLSAPLVSESILNT